VTKLQYNNEIFNDYKDICADNYNAPVTRFTRLELDDCSKELLRSINSLIVLDQLFERFFYTDTKSISSHETLKKASRTYHYLVNNAREKFKTRIEWLLLDKFIKVMILSKLLNLVSISGKDLYLLFFPYISFLQMSIEDKTSVLKKFDELLSLFIAGVDEKCISKLEKDGEISYFVTFI
jgi:hypothetical protein